MYGRGLLEEREREEASKYGVMDKVLRKSPSVTVFNSLLTTPNESDTYSISTIENVPTMKSFGNDT